MQRQDQAVWRGYAVILLAVAAICVAMGWLTDIGWLSVVGKCGAAGAVLLWGVSRVMRRRYPTRELMAAGAAAGEHRAMRGQAMMHKLGGDVDSAELLLRSAVDGGDVESMWEMGRLTEERDGIEAAEQWFRMAADHQHMVARAMFRPGGLYNRDGTGAPLQQLAATVAVPMPPPALALYGVPDTIVVMIAVLCQVFAGVALAVSGGPWWWALVAYALTMLVVGVWRDHARDGSNLPIFVFLAMVVAVPASAGLVVWALLR